MSISVNDFLRLALTEIRSARAGDVPSPDDLGDALLIFNELLDALNAEGRGLYGTLWQTHQLTANHQPHSIGLAVNAPDLTTAVARPTKIVGANLVIANNIRVPFRIVDDEEWQNIRAGAATGQAITITSAVPLILFYADDWPNGNIYLWPVESTAYKLELVTQTLLAALAVGDTFDLPMGYQLALRLTLAESLANAWGQPIGPDLTRRAKRARDIVWSNNDTIPNLDTRDGGCPGGPRPGGYNYLTGMID